MMRFLMLCGVLSVCVHVAHAEPKKADKPLDVLVVLLDSTDDPAVQKDVLRGMADALAGRRNMAAPKGWSSVHQKLSASKDDEVRSRTLALSVMFGDPTALASLLKTLKDTTANSGRRREALELLLDKGAEGMPAILRTLLDEKSMRHAAIKGLARFNEADTPALLLARYPKLSTEEKAVAIATLASRPGYALALLNAVEKKTLPRADVTPFTARQIAALNNKKVSERLEAVWGSVRATTKDRQAQLAKYRKLATKELLQKADRGIGRVLWTKHCASCHTLFGEGGKIGPDLTGSQRANPEYILTKLLDPSAVVQREFQVTRIVTGKGRVITALVKEEAERVLILQTPTEELRVLKSDIEERTQLRSSLMPEGLLNQLTNQEIQHLLSYVGGKDQVPLKK